MNAVVKEWVAKVEGDFATARRESRVARSANHDAVCFHAQQGAEKYLKALLIPSRPSCAEGARLGRAPTRLCLGLPPVPRAI